MGHPCANFGPWRLHCFVARGNFIIKLFWPLGPMTFDPWGKNDHLALLQLSWSICVPILDLRTCIVLVLEVVLYIAILVPWAFHFWSLGPKPLDQQKKWRATALADMMIYQYAKFELAGFCHFSATQGFIKSLKKEKKEKEKEKEAACTSTVRSGRR